MSDVDSDAEEMRCALSAIANEMQRFNKKPSSTNETPNNEDILCALLKCKSNLNLKEEQIRMLRQNLKIACTLAKTLSAAKEKETASLNNQLSYARNQYWEVSNQQKELTNTINTLHAENQILCDKLQCYNNFIQLGYQELQNVRDESFENIPSLKQLQKIILCCGQYYADYCNEHEKCKQLEQKNRFLNSKIRILESHLYSEEIRADSNNKKLNKEKGDALIKPNKCSDIGVVRSDCQIGSNNNFANLKMTKIELSKLSVLEKNMNNLDLTCHFSTIKKLLHDQDSLINDLKCISNEINLETYMG